MMALAVLATTRGVARGDEFEGKPVATSEETLPPTTGPMETDRDPLGHESQLDTEAAELWAAWRQGHDPTSGVSTSTRLEGLIRGVSSAANPAELASSQAESSQAESSRAAALPRAGTDLRLRSIRELSADVAAPAGALPPDAAAEHFAAQPEFVHVMGATRSHVEKVVHWVAPATCHQPLYFEEVNLERHGYSVGLFQPALSGAHFFSRLPALPYLAVSQRRCQCTYTLGHGRPGSPAPYVWHLPRFSPAGGVLEATAVIGLIYAIP